MAENKTEKTYLMLMYISKIVNSDNKANDHHYQTSLINGYTGEGVSWYMVT